MNKYYQIVSYKSIPPPPPQIPDAAQLKLLTNDASGQGFTPLESPSNYAGDGGNTCKSRSTSSFLKAGSKPCPFKRGLLRMSLALAANFRSLIVGTSLDISEAKDLNMLPYPLGGR